MIMPAVTATEAKNRLGRVLRQAAREPVTIEKSGAPVAVVLSYEVFRRYQALEDRYWGERAKKARERGGYTGGDALLSDMRKRIE
jgi:prevent-host-death family protein